MSFFSHPTVCTIKGLKKTIERDKRVFRWFLYLIQQPKIKDEIMNKEHLQRIYQKIKLMYFVHNSLNIIILCMVIIAFFLRSNNLLLAGVAVFLLYTQVHVLLRKKVAEVSMRLICQDFDEQTIGKNTLFQIGDYYAKKFNINSLVHSITADNNIFRTAIVAFIILQVFVYPYDDLYISIIMFITFYFSCQIINFLPIYRRLN